MSETIDITMDYRVSYEIPKKTFEQTKYLVGSEDKALQMIASIAHREIEQGMEKGSEVVFVSAFRDGNDV